MGRILSIAAIVIAMAGAAQAEPALGLWASPPDHKGQTGIVQVGRCGARLCGTLIKAFDPAGQQITTANVGKRLLWDMQAQGGGSYGDGRVYVPMFGRDYPAQMTVTGTQMTVKGCLAGVCKSQTWRRVN
ncbi:MULTISPECIES: DUF2147 domain-containing protein [unclassified Marinovum]